GIKEATPDPLLKNVPVIVLSDEDSDVPATNKHRRLTKNGSIVNDNVHIISSDDDVVLPLSIKKTNQEEIESDDECPIRFSRNRNTKLQSSSKILTGSLIDEDTDEDIGKDNQADDENDNLFHDEAIVDSHIAAKGLFILGDNMGPVVDSFIPMKRLKDGKRFGFVRFINVQIGIDREWDKYKTANQKKHEGRKNTFYDPSKEAGTFDSRNSFVNVLKGTNMVKETDSSPVIVLEEDCLNSKDLSNSLIGRVKDVGSLSNLKKVLCNEGFDNIFVRYMGELWVLLEFDNTKAKKLFGTIVRRSRKFKMSEIPRTGGSILSVMEEIVKVGITMGYNMDGCANDITKIIESQGGYGVNKFLSDHRPILLREASFDYGPTPFRFFHFWFDVDGFDKFVTDSWKDAPRDDSNAMRNLCGKLKFLKVKIRAWNSFSTLDKGLIKPPIDAHIDMPFSNSLSMIREKTLSVMVSKEEGKRAVWDCGTDKSPGPDGFTFVFYRHFWSTIENDVFEAINKIMGIHVDADRIKSAASKLGCLVLNTPFLYLRTKVGENMSRVHAWKEEVKKLQNQGVNIFDYIRGQDRK
ncbi:hypothetical protein Tco_0333085, partial [Tanacetum coccineum]